MSDLKLRYPDHEHNEMGDTTIEICVDCMMSEAGYNEPDTTQDGTYNVCPEWEGWSFSQKYAEDDPDHYGDPLYGFSWSQCDGCHSTLGGDRYEVMAIHWSCPEDDRLSDQADNDLKERQHEHG